MRQSLRIYFGLFIWLVGGISIAYFSQAQYESLSPQQKRLFPQLQTHFVDHPKIIEILFEHWVWIVPGDQVCIRNQAGQKVVIGRVIAAGDRDPYYVCQIKLYHPFFEQVTQNTLFNYVETRAEQKVNVGWILNTLVPEEKKKEITAVITRFLQQNRAYLGDIFIPLVRDLFQETYRTLEQQLPDIWKSHQEKLLKILEKHKATTLEKELLPVLKEQLLPIIKKEAGPTIEAMGMELWKTFPKWSIAWKSIYQKIPGTDDDHVQKRWQRYLSENVQPALKKWSPQILKAFQKILVQATRDKEIAGSVKKSLVKVFNDKEFLTVLLEMFRDVILDNDVLKERLKKHFEKPAFQKQLAFLSARFDPYIEEISDLLFLDKNKEGISPNLAQVLRSQILHKDTRFIYVEFREGKAKQELEFFGLKKTEDPFQYQSKNKEK